MSGICIIGGGASGMAAAITAKKYAPDRAVIILEKMKEPGRKLKATGNGRCNLSNA
ncbi:MAG: NAD(P)/FAD-dependent oxidoreductase, partial [Hornefia butyriciproducens]|nr:NAD(P)/FAD-dependent oxidoreductase [Hornefia butyriciproducens]